MRWTGHVASLEDRQSVFRFLVGTPDEKQTLGRPKCSWEYNIRMDLHEVGWRGINRIGLIGTGGGLL